MLRRTKKKIIPVIVIIVLVSAIIISAFLRKSMKDMPEIQKYVSTYKTEFKSKRGFGNDRFDIYSFSLKEDGQKIFKVIDNDCKEIFNEFDALLEIELSEKNNSLKKEIIDIEKKRGSKYKYFTRNGTKKLYLYNEELKKGYCLILAI